MKLYHGGKKILKNIDKNYMFLQESRCQEGVGIYFTEDINIAKVYGNKISMIEINIENFLNARESLIDQNISIFKISNFLSELDNLNDDFWEFFTNYGIDVTHQGDISKIGLKKVAELLAEEEIRNLQIELCEKVGIDSFLKAWFLHIKKDGLYNKELGFYSILNTSLKVFPI